MQNAEGVCTNMKQECVFTAGGADRSDDGPCGCTLHLSSLRGGAFPPEREDVWFGGLRLVRWLKSHVRVLLGVRSKPQKSQTLLFKKVSKESLHASSTQRSSPSLTSVVPTGTSFSVVLTFKRKNTRSWFHPRWINKYVFTGFCAASEIFFNAFFGSWIKE